MPIKYIPYFPNTVEGQAILNNFVRTRRALQYRDDDKVFTKIKRGMPCYEVEKVESVGNNPKNMLIRGECVSACAYLKEKGIKVDLVYIDPPFASGADYAKKVYMRRNPKVAAAIKKVEETLDIDELKAFEEKMYGDIWNKEAYLNWMYENLMAIKSVMSETASIFVHIDWHIGHYMKILLDEVLGEYNFRNEIIWWYPSGQDPSKNFNRKHDTIFWYSKNSEEWIFNFEAVAIPYTKEQEERFDQWDKEKKNWYYWNINPRGERVKTYKKAGIGEYDVWNIGINATEIKEIGYSTTKPPKLLERIIKASSTEGMLVADFFGGSGVAAKVTNDLKRIFIHVDVGVNSIQTARDRLKAAGAEFDILEIKDGVNLFRNPQQTMDKLKTMILGLRNEDKLDKFWEGAIQDSKLGTIPVYLPNLLDHTTKVLDKYLMNRIINEAIPDLPDNVKKVIVYYIDIDNQKEIEKFIKEQTTTDIEIKLSDLKEILDDVVVDDVVQYKMEESNGAYEIEITKFISDRLRKKIDEHNHKGLLQPLTETETGNGNGSGEEEENGNGKKKKKFTPIEISKDGLELIEMVSLDCKNKDGIWHSDKEIKIDKLGYVIEDGNKTKTFWNAKITCKKNPLRMKVRNIAGDEVIISLTEGKKQTDKAEKKKSKAK